MWALCWSDSSSNVRGSLHMTYTSQAIPYGSHKGFKNLQVITGQHEIVLRYFTNRTPVKCLAISQADESDLLM